LVALEGVAGPRRRRETMYRVCALVLVLSVLCAWPAAADVACDDLGVGLTFGMMQPTGGDNDYEDSGLIAGLMVRKPMTERVAIQFDYKHGETLSGEFPDMDIFPSDGSRFEMWGEPDDYYRTVWNHVGLSAVWNFSESGNVMPFLSGGLGMTFWEVQDWQESASPLGGVPEGYDSDGKSSDLNGTHLTAVLGLGADFFMGENFALTIGGRYYYLLQSDVDNVGFSAMDFSTATEEVDPADYVDANGSILEGYIGLSYYFGPGDCDGDGIVGKQDKCWRIPEDFDGFEDDDGCPDPDNDMDGILDVDDACPDEAEDFDGFEDEDGCPDVDTDGDGYMDRDDQCPNEPEDFDGYMDQDGCPDPDNDGDGVPDVRDECPNTPKGTEVLPNGCPKPKVELVAVMVNFDLNKHDLTPQATAKLDALAEVLLEDEEIVIEIAGHACDIGTADYNQQLSERRAAEVMGYLAGKGVAESRMSSAAFGLTQPLVPNTDETARSQNRRAMITPTRPE
jgi:outer membrane protein OmpA-like peptidoglycan-associated protein